MLTDDFSAETMEEVSGKKYSGVLKKKNCQPRILYPEKLSSKKMKVKDFPWCKKTKNNSEICCSQTCFTENTKESHSYWKQVTPDSNLKSHMQNKEHQ